MRQIVFVFLGAILAANLANAEVPAQPKTSIVFTAPNKIDRALVYVDKTESQPRCPCARFNVIVDDHQGDFIGSTSATKVVIRVKRGQTLVREQELPLRPIWRMANSPTKTQQFIQMLIPGVKPEALTFEIATLKRACLNPTEPSCLKEVEGITGELTLKQLHELEPTTAEDALRPRD